MPSGPIGEAFVKITPDVADFSAKAEEGTRGAFTSIDDLARATGETVAAAFHAAADAVAAAFANGSAETAISAIGDAGTVASESIASSFDAAALASGAALDSLAAGGQFSTIDAEAVAAADGLATGFESAANAASTAVDAIDITGLTNEIDDATNAMDGLAQAADGAASATDSIAGPTGETASNIGGIGTAAEGAAVGLGAASGGLGELLKTGAETLGLIEVVKFLKEATTSAQELAAIQRVTSQIIQTTGGAAHITAGQIEELSASQALKTGIDKASIETADNLLLTFSNVKNAGEGSAAIFDRATVAAQDLSTVLGTGLTGSTKLLGKALNDPVNGASALGRVLGKLSTQEKDHIKSLVDHGKTVEAQGFILDKVASRFGGAATAAADPIAQLNVVLKELEEGIGKGILAGIEPIAQAFVKLAPTLAPIAEGIGQSLGGALAQIAPLLPAIAKSFVGLLQALLPLLPSLLELATSILLPLVPVLPPIVSGISLMAEAISKVLQFLSPVLPVLLPIVAILSGFLTPAGIFIAAFIAIEFIVSKVVDALGGFDNIKDAVFGFFENLGSHLADIGRSVGDFFTNLPGVIASAASSLVSTVLPALVGFAERIFLFFSVTIPLKVFDALVGLGAVLLRAFLAAADFVVTSGPTILLRVLEFIATLPFRVAALLVGLSIILVEVFISAFAAVVAALPGMAAAVFDFFVALPGEIIGPLVDVGGLLLGIFVDAFTTVIGAIPGLIQTILDFFTALPGEAVNALSTFGSEIVNVFTTAFSDAVSAVTTGFSNIVGSITGFIGSIPGLAGQALSAMAGFGDSVVSGIADGLKSAPGVISGFVGDAAAAVVGAIEKVIHGIAHSIDKALSFHFSILGHSVGFDAHLENLLPFAAGGIVDSATLGLIGEAGREAIIPLTNPDRAFELVQQSGLLGIIQKATAFTRAAALGATPTISGTANVAGVGGVSVTIGPGAVVVQFNGSVSSDEAFAVGQQVGAGLAKAIAERQSIISTRAVGT